MGQGFHWKLFGEMMKWSQRGHTHVFQIKGEYLLKEELYFHGLIIHEKSFQSYDFLKAEKYLTFPYEELNSGG
jgi:hypothetical protein